MYVVILHSVLNWGSDPVFNISQATIAPDVAEGTALCVLWDNALAEDKSHNKEGHSK